MLTGLCWIHFGRLFGKKSGYGTVGVSKDSGVEAFDERVVRNYDMSNDGVEPVIAFSSILCVCMESREENDRKIE